MGLIIMPFVLLALILSIYAITKCYGLINSKNIGLKEIAFGLGISLGLFGLISLSYILEGRAWELSPAFRIPIFMIFIPFIIHLVTKGSSKQQVKYLSTLILISIGLTGVLGIIFNDLFFGLIDYLNIEKYH